MVNRKPGQSRAGQKFWLVGVAGPAKQRRRRGVEFVSCPAHIEGVEHLPVLSDVVRTEPEVIRVLRETASRHQSVAKRVPILAVSGGGGAQAGENWVPNFAK